MSILGWLFFQFETDKLVNFLPQNSGNITEEKYRLFHALTAPSVIDAILTAYKES